MGDNRGEGAAVVRRLPARVLQELLECAPEVVVEDGVDDGIEEAVHVAEPDEEGEHDGTELARGHAHRRVVTDADGVEDVDGEERNPAEEENSCNGTTHICNAAVCW